MTFLFTKSLVLHFSKFSVSDFVAALISKLSNQFVIKKFVTITISYARKCITKIQLCLFRRITGKNYIHHHMIVLKK